MVTSVKFEKSQSKGHGAVLVVEDDQELRVMLQEILEGEGYPVVTASNGKEALTQLDKHDIGLVLLDLMMPVMDGWQFLDVIKQEPNLQELPVVLLSASKQTVGTKNQYRVKAVVTKPFELDSLLESVEKYRS